MDKIFLVTSGDYSDYKWHVAVLGSDAESIKKCVDILVKVEEETYIKRRKVQEDWRKEKFGFTQEEIFASKVYKLSSGPMFNKPCPEWKNSPEYRAYSAFITNEIYNYCPVTLEYRRKISEIDKFIEATNCFNKKDWLISNGFNIIEIEEVHISN